MTTTTGERWEGRAQVLIMLAIGAASGAASFTHVADVAARHGQQGWLAWADAITLELMSITSGLEMRRRKRQHRSTTMPFGVLLIAVTLSLSAQILQAEPTVVGWVAAAVPALGFLVMAKMALGRTTAVAAPEPVAEPAVTVAEVTVPAPTPAPVVTAPAPVPANHPATRDHKRQTRRPLAQSLAMIDKIRSAEPGITVADLADRLGLSQRRTRQIIAVAAS